MLRSKKTKKDIGKILRDFRLNVGEAAAFSLLEEMEADIILTDDGELIKLCKRHNIHFICAMAIVSTK